MKPLNSRLLWLLLTAIALPANAESLAICSMNADGTDLQIHVSDPNLSFGSVAVSPDGKRLAFDSWPASGFVQSKQQIHACDLDGGNMHVLSMGAMPKWSPDGELITFHEYLNLKGSLVIESDGGGQELLAEKKGSPTWWNGGKSLALLDWGRNNVTLLDMVSGVQTPLRPYPVRNVNHGFCISPDGQTICFTQGSVPNCRLCIATMKGKARPLILHQGEISGGLNFHPNGKQVVFSQGLDSKHDLRRPPAQLFLIDIALAVEDKEHAVRRIDGTRRDELYLNPCFSPDGERIFFSSTAKAASR